jgi:hypothetical protein
MFAQSRQVAKKVQIMHSKENQELRFPLRFLRLCMSQHFRFIKVSLQTSVLDFEPDAERETTKTWRMLP